MVPGARAFPNLYEEKDARSFAMRQCASCGAEVTADAVFCLRCGSPLPPEGTAGPGAAAPPGPPPPGAAPPAPGVPAQVPGYPRPYAPVPFYPPYPLYPVAPPYVRRSGLPLAGGALSIAGGSLGLVGSLLTFLLLPGSILFPFSGFGSIAYICGGIGVVFGTFAIVGGVLALQRRMWALALTGSILGIFSGAFLGIGSVLCFVAMILLAISSEEFVG